MTERDRQPDDVERHVSERFRSDLRALYDPPGGVPPRVDKTILNEAHRRLARPRRLIVRLRWAPAAAAAVIVLGTVLHTMTRDTPHSELRNPHSLSPAAAAKADLDRNGRVDILDAFRLARHIESRGQLSTEWDLNGDGVVDRKDVDLIALAAVRLSHEPQVSRGEGILPLRGEAILASLLPPRDVPILPDRPEPVGCVPRTATEPERWCVIRTLPETRVTVEDALDKGV